MSSLSAYIPPADGLLPKWLLLIAIVSLANSVQAYASLGPTRRVYPGSSRPLPEGIPAKTAKKTSQSPVTPLSSRTFGTWTAITAIVRLYAAYHIQNPQLYELAFWSFGVAGAHFVSEWLIFGTSRLGAGLAAPLAVSSCSLVWMWAQRDHYVGA